MTAHTIQTYPLDAIAISDMNPRQTHDDADIAALATSIAVAGLIQPLACYLPDTGQPEVVDGGRRLLALRHLRSQGSKLFDAIEPDWKAIPCVTTTDHMQASAWAGAAAESVLPLTPVQEIRAYGAMAAQGNSPDMIARAFARTIRHVKGRLALANLSQPTLDALDTGQITLDIAKLLTLADSQQREIHLLDTAIEQGWSAFSLRRELHQGTIRATDRRAVYVTLDAYAAAGGTLREDLFGDDTTLDDPKLLDELFREKLQAATDDLATGWQWATPVFDQDYLSYEQINGHMRLLRTPGELTKADTAEYDRLAELYNGDALDDDGIATLEALQSRLDGDWTDADRDVGGLFTLVDRTGELRLEAFRRAGARPATPDADSDADAPTPEPEPKPTPQNAIDDFRRIQLAAIQTAALDQFETLLTLLAFQLEHGLRSYNRPLAISTEAPNIAPEKDSGLTLDARLDQPETRFGAPTADEFTVFAEQGRKHRNAVLTRHLARLVQPPAVSDFQAAFCASLDPAPRSLWTPDAANCFARLPVPALDALWADLVPPDKADTLDPPFASLKKGQKAKELEKLFSSADYRELLGLSREENAAIDAWMPVEMRGADK